MSNKTDNANQAEDAATPKKREVLCRFSVDELDAMKRETGAERDGTAVAGFVRKNLRKVEG